jgi:hypothetical protein
VLVRNDSRGFAVKELYHIKKKKGKKEEGDMQENTCKKTLYNSYGYGCAPGMNYKNAEGRREMLWPQDLDEILSVGRTKNGCIIV